MNILAISDIHGFLIDIPKCDTLLICGDFCPATSHSIAYQEQWINDKFIKWLNGIDCKNIVITPGNHDMIFDKKYKTKEDLESIESMVNKNCKILINELVEIDGIKIFGTPYCKRFGNWAFMRDEFTLCEKYSEIPEGVDILMSHDAPLIGGLGTIFDRNPVEEAGNSILAHYIKLSKPRYVLCGHIHSGDHNGFVLDDTTFYNVSICNEQYNPVNLPLILNL